MSRFFCIFAQNFDHMASANLFRRYVWLINAVYSEGKITPDRLSELWSKSNVNADHEPTYTRKQLLRHRTAIAQIFGIFIEMERSPRIAYYIENVNDIKGNLIQKWALNAFAVQGMLMDSGAIKSRLLFEDIPSGHRYLTTVIQAMRTNSVIEMTYKGFTRETPHTFRVHPYCLKVFRLRWYMVGYNEEYGELRIYSLDRVHALATPGDTFVYPSDFDGATYFEDYFGTVRNTDVDPERVEIEVDPHTANYIRTLPLHHSQKEVEKTPERSVFSFYIAPTYDFIQELRTQGPDLKVLKPAWLAERLRDDAKKTVKLYK